MNFKNTEVWGFKHATRGLRNPLESWDKSDSYYNGNGEYIVGENDLTLAKKLIKAGGEHRKFLRQIFVSVDITAPLYWYKEFDTYRIGITENSTSTMHKLASTPITIDCFETNDEQILTNEECGYFSDDYAKNSREFVERNIIDFLETLRVKYNETKDKRFWRELICWLPESWLQTRTVTLNYENILNIYHQRRNHKHTEWTDGFCKWEESLPYFNDFFDEILKKED